MRNDSVISMKIIPNDICIYGLVDPIIKDIRYVGKTQHTPAYRLKTHMQEARRGKSQLPIYRWIRKLESQKLEPSIILIAKVSHCFWEKAEQICIAYMRDIVRTKNLNISDGGEGGTGVKQSEETKLKKSLKLKGRYFSPEHRARISKAGKGRKLSEETKAKLWRNRERKPFTPEQIKQRSDHFKSLWNDPKHREYMRKLRTGKKMSETARVNMSRSQKGRIVTDKHRENLRISHIGKNVKHFITYKGIKKPAVEWAKEKNIPSHILIWRSKQGWEEKDIFTPLRKTKPKK